MMIQNIERTAAQTRHSSAGFRASLLHRFGFILLSAMLISSCSSFHARGYRFVDRGDINLDASLPRLPLKGEKYTIEPQPNGLHTTEFSTSLTGEDPTTAPIVLAWNSVCIDGVLNGERTYPVILDTGNPDFFEINDLHVFENNLPILPDPDLGGANVHTGLARIESLKLGGLTISNLLGTYYGRHVDKTYFGFRTDSTRHINLGLPILRSFKYIVVDQPAGRIVISAASSLANAPSGPLAAGTNSIPFEYIDIAPGLQRLSMTVPVDGRLCRLALDTGLVNGMILRKGAWDLIHPNSHLDARPPGSVFIAPYQDVQYKTGSASYNILMPSLRLGPTVLKDVELIVPAGEAQILKGFDGFVGMQAFRGVRLIIDFENQRLLIGPSSQGKDKG